MRKLVLGSLNIDKTYRVEELVKPGETVSVKKFESFCGGKGFNQAIALARAGGEVYFAGVAGYDGDDLINSLKQDGISTEYIKRSNYPNGHAVIQVDDAGQNSIMVVPGSNGEVSEKYIDEVLAGFGEGDLLVLQNEVACVDYAILQAKRKGMTIAFNPSPFNSSAQACDFKKVDILLVNEVEIAAIAGCENEIEIIAFFQNNYPNLCVAYTKGKQGAMLLESTGKISSEPATDNKPIDTTAAGDTFTGYFLEFYLKTKNAKKSLRIANVASGISVTRKGASPSIPYVDEVLAKAASKQG